MAEEAEFPPLSPSDVTELTEAQEDRQNALKQEGVELLEDGKQEEALGKLTEAITIGCASAMLLTRRAQLLVTLGRPGAAINDCTAALAVNPDSAKAFKIRGKQYAKLEKWPEAHSDLQTALKIDYDEQTEEDSKEVEIKAKEARAAETNARVKAETDEYNRKLKESGEAYKAGLKENEEKFREERMKEEETKRKAEEERKARCNAGAKESQKRADDGEEPEAGVPKAHAPPGAEEVD